MKLNKIQSPRDTATIWEEEWEGWREDQKALAGLVTGNSYAQNWNVCPSLSLMQTHWQGVLQFW